MVSGTSLTLPEALALMRRVKEDKAGDANIGASEEDIRQAQERLQFPFPKAWQGVLRIAHNVELPSTDGELYFRFFSSRVIHPSNESTFKFLRDLSPPQLVVAEDLSQDALVLDVTRRTPEGECPVVWISHSGGGEDSRWESVAAFLQSMFSGDAPEDEAE